MLDKRIKDNIRKNDGGIYIVSYIHSPNNKTTQKLVKIGMATNLLKRLDSYHTCYPMSFYTYSVIITKGGLLAKDIKKIERDIHKELDNLLYKHQVYDARNPGEWYLGSTSKLVGGINKILEKDNEQIKEIVNFHNGFKLELKGKDRSI
jgi:hypothetical protein